MSYEFEGRLKKILPINEVSTTFRKQEFVLVTDEEYPQLIKFELHKEKTALITPFFLGDMLRINFNILGREWIDPLGKRIYFNTFQVWKIKKVVDGYIQPHENNPNKYIQYNLNLPDAKDVFSD